MSGTPEGEGSPPARLGRRFFVGSLYVGGGGWLTSGLNFALNLAIARVLGPEILGFYALVQSVNMVINVVGAFSPGLAVIQSRSESQRLYDSAFAIAFLLAAAGLLITAGVAPFLAWLHSPLAGWFLVIFALIRFPAFLQHIPLARLERRLRYRAVAAINLITGNIPNLLGLAFALLGASAWSLLIRDAAMAGLGLALALALSGYRYRGEADRESRRRVMDFSRPMFVSRALEIALDRIDRLSVGGFLGDARLGFYNQARFLSEGALIAARPFGRLSFNLYSRLQDDPARLGRAYELINTFLVRLVFAGSATLLVAPEPTIRLLLGQEWMEAAPILRWLALHAGLLPLFENMKELLYGRGEVGRSVFLRVVQLGVFSVGIGAGVLLDETIWVAAGLLATTVVGVLLAARSTRELRTSGLAPLLAVPGLSLVAGSAAAWLALQGPLAGLPWALWPFVPPIFYGLLLALLEGRKLLRQLRYLRAIARGQAPPGPA